MNTISYTTELEYNIVPIKDSKFSLLELTICEDPLNNFYKTEYLKIIDNVNTNHSVPNFFKNLKENINKPLLKTFSLEKTSYQTPYSVELSDNLFLKALYEGAINWDKFWTTISNNLNPSHWYKSTYSLKSLLLNGNITPCYVYQSTHLDFQKTILHVLNEKEKIIYFPIKFIIPEFINHEKQFNKPLLKKVFKEHIDKNTFENHLENFHDSNYSITINYKQKFIEFHIKNDELYKKAHELFEEINTNLNISSGHHEAFYIMTIYILKKLDFYNTIGVEFNHLLSAIYSYDHNKDHIPVLNAKFEEEEIQNIIAQIDNKILYEKLHINIENNNKNIKKQKI